MYKLENKTVKGLSPLTINKTAKNKMKVFPYGYTHQETRSGKNLVNVFETVTTNTGFTLPDVSISKDGFVTYENTGGYRNALFNTFEAEPSTTYYSYLEVTEQTRTPVVYLREFNENMEQLRVSYPKNQNFVTMSTTKYIQYGLTTDAYTSTGKFTARPMIVKTSSVDNVYEPYGAMPSPDFPSDIRNVGDNINLFNIDTIEFGWIKAGVVSLDAKNICSDYIYLEPNCNYTISLKTSVKEISYALYDENKTYIKNTYNSNNIVSDTSKRYIRFWVNYDGSTTMTKDFAKTLEINFKKGTVETSYSEYGCGSVVIKIENKNKINLGELTTSSNAGLTSKTEKSVWEITGTSNTNGYANSTGRISIGKIKAGTYTFSWNYIGKLPYNETNYATISIYNVKTGNVIVNKRVDIDDKSEQFTLTEDTELKLGIWNVGSGNVYDVEFYLQLEEGEKTDYEEHQEQIVSFPLSEGQLLHKGDYLAEDGIHQVRKTIVLNGTENWQYDSNTSRYYLQGTDHKQYKDGGKCISSHYKYIIPDTNDEGIYTGNSTFLFIRVTNITSLTKFKAMLAEQYENGTPVTVEYELAEEVVIPYTEEQEYVLNHIYSYEETATLVEKGLIKLSEHKNKGK